jgi:thimet oligopeptidase
MHIRPLALALAGLLGCAHVEAPAAAPAAAPATPVAAASSPNAAPRAFADLAAVDVAGLRTLYSPPEIGRLCAAAEKTADAKLAALVSVPEGMRTFGNSVGAYEQAMTDYADTAQRLAFLKDIHPDAKVRAAGSACEERAGKYGVTVGARKDIYLALRSYLDHAGKSDPLDATDRKLIEVTMRDFLRNGLALSDADREKLTRIRSRLTELSTKFSSNLDEDTTSIMATKAELDGLPVEFIARHEETRKGDAYVITTKYPDAFPVLDNAKSEALRKRMYFAFNGRKARENLPLLTEAIALRDQAAKLLGFANHADFVADVRMAKNSKTVGDFLARLRTELVPARDRLNAQMLALKVKETKNRKATLEDWDFNYYLNEIKKADFAIDDEQVRAYFPSDKALAGMFQVYATLFNVKFDEVSNPEAWSPGVALYTIHDGLDGKGKLLAKFYVDLFPRDGKYGHAASFGLGVSREVSGGYQIPLSALVVNFNPPQNGQSAKLSLKEVDTLFHEFGHIMHMSLTTARYNSIAGSNVSVDFVEAPSQMLENWVYRPEVLALITQDPANPLQTMPVALQQKLAQARTFDAGIRYTRQVFLASFDQAIHTGGEKVDPDAVDHTLRAQIMGYPVNQDEHFAATFGHMMGGYDAGYYGYLWSEVFADDMFSRFEAAGVLDSKTGKAYRDIILAKGRTEEPGELLKQFLGREPNEEAFLRLTGIRASSGAPAHHDASSGTH